jgi:hypothetical protein
MNKWLASILILCLAAAFSIPTSAVVSIDEIKVYVNAVQIEFPDQKPMINSDSRTLVPVRFVSQALGANVDWDGDKVITLDTSTDIINNRTMVPLRFVSECLGAEVKWNGERERFILAPPCRKRILLWGNHLNQVICLGLQELR